MCKRKIWINQIVITRPHFRFLMYCLSKNPKNVCTLRKFCIFQFSPLTLQNSNLTPHPNLRVARTYAKWRDENITRTLFIRDVGRIFFRRWFGIERLGHANTLQVFRLLPENFHHQFVPISEFLQDSPFRPSTFCIIKFPSRNFSNIWPDGIAKFRNISILGPKETSTSAFQQNVVPSRLLVVFR